MPGQNDDKALTFTRLMQLEYRSWSKREQWVRKLFLSVHFVLAVDSFKYVSDPAPVRIILNQVTHFIYFYHNQWYFFIMNKTTIPTVITILCVVYLDLLLTSFYPKIYVKSIAKICFFINIVYCKRWCHLWRLKFKWWC